MAKKKDGAAIMIAVGKPAPGDEGEGLEEEAPEEEGFPEEEGEGLPPEEEAEAGEGAYPEFSIPEGLDLSDLEPGEEKEVLCLIGKTSDGSACIKQVDGIDLAGEGQGMYGPPPAPPVPPAPPAGGPPLGGMPLEGMPMPPGAPVRAAARGRGLM